MKKLLVLLILLVVVGFGAYFFLFVKKDICKNVVPEDAKAVMLLDAKQAITQMDFSISDIFKALKHQKENDSEEWGIDMLSPMYGFVSNDNYVGGVFALNDAKEFEEKISEENRQHLLGNVSEMQSICNRTGCRELLVVSNFSGYRESFDINWLDSLGLRVFLLIGNAAEGNFALVNLKYLH